MEGGKARGWGAVPIPGILNTPWGQAELRLGFMVQRSSSWTPCVVVVAMGTGGDSIFAPQGLTWLSQPCWKWEHLADNFIFLGCKNLQFMNLLCKLAGAESKLYCVQR